MTETKETTVPNPSVGADGEQPISKTSVSIPDAAGDCNPAALDTENYFREMERMTDPAYLPTITMQGLYEKVYDSRPAIIKGLLHTGTYLFVGAPKVGKSFFMAQLAYHVSTGISLWDYPVRKGTVLYLALEDDHRRLQSRLFRMFGTESTEDLHFATYSHKLGAGLEDQLQCFVREHPDMKLIIIDTLQKIRESDSERSCYASDYKVVSQLKQFADAKGICLLLVHHTRKQQADDKFDMISGTNGLLGAADGAFLLQKAKRTDSTATLDVSGRDQQDQRFHLIRDPERLLWQLDRTETEPQKEPPDPVLEAVSKIVTEEQPEWNGTATELAEMISGDLTPISLHAAQCSGWEADGRVSHPLRADPDPRRSEDQTDIDSRYGVTTVTTVTTSVVASQGRHGRHGCHGLKGKIGAKRPPKGLAV